ncbi:ABC transporter substrate-binding protein [Microbacterium sp.]|uniref:ABC transporter substrate-binding protein n=1 Tax=Microbacterium sp. TaxID=51671 RepID=UPI0039E6B27D
MTLTRRQLLMAGLGTVALGSLSGCATPGTTSVNSLPTIPPANGEKVTIEYWAWLKDLQKVADVFNASHPNIYVKAVPIVGGNAGGYQKMYSAIAAGGGPDLGQVELRAIPEFMLVNGLVDVSRYGADDHASTFDPTLWAQVSFNGGVYGIPQDSGPMGTFYQTPAYEKIGAEPPKTWTEWAEVGREFRKADIYIDVFGLNDASFFCSFATQAGAQWLTPTEDGWVINLTDEGTLEVARFFDKAVDDDIVSTAIGPYSPGWYAAAAKGEIASWTVASWGDALVEGVAGGSGLWRVAPMPTWSSGFGSSYIGGSTTAVMANSKHPQEALEFALWLNSTEEGINTLIDYSGVGWSPVPGIIGTKREKPSEFFSGQNYNEEVFVPASKEQNPNWAWWPITQQTFNILADGFRKKASGTTLVDSVATAEEHVITAFRNKGLSIRKAGE